MSKQIYLESNDLVLTEEAFDKHRAVVEGKDSKHDNQFQTSPQLPSPESLRLSKSSTCDPEVEISSTVNDQDNIKTTLQLCNETENNVDVSNTIVVSKVRCRRKNVKNPKNFQEIESVSLFQNKNDLQEQMDSEINVSDKLVSTTHIQSDAVEDEVEENGLKKIVDDTVIKTKGGRIKIPVPKDPIRKRGRPRKNPVAYEKKKCIKSGVNVKNKKLKKNLSLHISIENSTYELDSHKNKDIKVITTTENKIKTDDSLKEIAEELDTTKEHLKLGTDKSNNSLLDGKFVDDTDNISLSELKNRSKITEEKELNLSQLDTRDDIINDHSGKRNSKKVVISDFEYNIDKIVGESNESSTGRPRRKKGKLNLHYEEDSDEDPFANVELSDDDGEPKRYKKGKRYFSDDEYVPFTKHRKISTSDTTDSDNTKHINDPRKTKKRNLSIKSPKKKGKRFDTLTLAEDASQSMDTTLTCDDDSQNKDTKAPVESTVNLVDDDLIVNNAEIPKEFENFLAKKIQGTNLKIKRVTNIEPRAITPLEIPVIDSYLAKKTVDVSSQTNILKTACTSVQTTTANDLPMKNNVPLSLEQAEKACEFLKDIVKTTAELGELMKQKSEDFIKKKINTKHVTNTFTMDYCVRKSYLLLKLTKHNLLEMEENLSKQYEIFLKDNDLLQHREVEKSITPTLRLSERDSDCEIIEESSGTEHQKQKTKPKFNLKTVFLNKELSIKIAKKPNEEPKTKEKIHIEGKNPVWISDSVLVKKIKPTQSFLAQDSRNKKPPDKIYVTKEMVSNFFRNYYHQRALSICAPYVCREWHNEVKEPNIWCNYFHVEPTVRHLKSKQPLNNKAKYPKKLLLMCLEMLQRNVCICQTVNNNTFSRTSQNNYKIIYVKQSNNPDRLLQLCLHSIGNILNDDKNKTVITSNPKVSLNLKEVNSLKKLCYNKLIPVYFIPTVLKEIDNSQLRQNFADNCKDYNEKPLLSPCVSNSLHEQKNCEKFEIMGNTQHYHAPKSLKLIAYSLIVQIMTNNLKGSLKNPVINRDNKICNVHKTKFMEKEQFMIRCKNEELLYDTPKSLKHLTYLSIFHIMPKSLKGKLSILNKTQEKCLINNQSNFLKTKEDTGNEHVKYNTPRSLKHLVHLYLMNFINNNNKKIINATNSSIKLHQVKTMFQISFENLFITDESKLTHSEGNSIKINCVNTVPEETFHSFLELSTNSEDDYVDYENDEFTYEDMYENYCKEEIPFEEDYWEPREIKEAPNCDVDSNTPNLKQMQITFNEIDNTDPTIQIKIEQDNYILNNYETPLIKTEQGEDLEEVNLLEQIGNLKVANQDNAFESAPGSKNLSYPWTDPQGENNNHEQKVFSQCFLRVRKQFEPDSDDENENTMSLLVPQTYKSIATHETTNKQIDNFNAKNAKKKFDKRKKKTKSMLSKKNRDVVQEVPSVNVGGLISKKNQQYLTGVVKESQSSDLDSVNVSLNTTEKENIIKNLENHNSAASESEIQCSDVDSTQNIADNIKQIPIKNCRLRKSVDCCNVNSNELQNYNNYINKLYSDIKFPSTSSTLKGDSKDKLKPNPFQSDEGEDKFVRSFSQTVNIHEPELLQCEPSFSFFDYNIQEDITRSLNTEEKNLHLIENDYKLCQEAIVVLEKLPETIIDKYFMSHHQTDVNQTLDIIPQKLSVNLPINENGMEKSTCLEKNCDGEDSKVIKEQPDVKLQGIKHERKLRSRNLQIKPKKYGEGNVQIEDDKCNITDHGDVTLTADKVMSQELKSLNTPVTINTDSDKCTDKVVKKNLTAKASGRMGHKDEMEIENQSSSDEEKQWVNTKNKILKKLVKGEKQLISNEAKRTRLINKFIKKCESPERKYSLRNGNARSRKNNWARQKQLNILSEELFGGTITNRKWKQIKSSQYYGKGRRNIRKVIDKKSLAQSTVIANMEENERKLRLQERHTKLREILGCEGDENVVVINDEVCLEYDFDQNQPVVSIHKYFTTVMKAHQYEGVKFMWDSCFESLEMIQNGHPGGGCILAHCMGLGKTLQVLALLHTVLTHRRIKMKRILVCCPLSTVLYWVDEINKWMGPVNPNIKVFELSRLKKIYERAYQLEDWYKGGGIFIIGYELFRNLTTMDPLFDNIRPKIIKKIRMALLDPGPDIIICDEGHLLKNDSSILAVAMSRVITKRRIVLTGTPMQNNLREYYCMVNFAKPNLLGLYSEYVNRFENPIMNGQHRDSREEDIKLMKERIHILHKVLEGVLQRQEASVLYPYLPKKHEYTVFIPLTKCQCDLYKHYLQHYTKNRHRSLIDYHILHKIWSHPQVLHNFYMTSRDDHEKVKVEKLEDDLAREDLTASEDVRPSQTEVWWTQYLESGDMLNALESSNKFLAAFRILDECIAIGDKVLIFSTSLFTLTTLEYFLKKIKNWSLGREYYRLDGSVPPEVRQNWCRQFNAESNLTTKLFLVSTRSGSLGLNMTAANRVIIFDTSWNPAHDMQSIFRVYRFGQKKDCYIYRLVALGTMEQKIYERSVTKQAVSCRVVDEQQIDRHYSMDELAELYKFDETGDGVDVGVAVGVTDVALLRAARDAPLHAVHEHDSLLRDSAEQQLPEDERAAAWRQFEQEQADKQRENLEKYKFRASTRHSLRSDNLKTLNKCTDKKQSDETDKTSKDFNRLSKKKSKRTSKICKNSDKKPANQEDYKDGTELTKLHEPKETPENISNNSEEVNIANLINSGEINIADLINNVQKIVVASLHNNSPISHDNLRESIKNVLLQSATGYSGQSNTSMLQSNHKDLRNRESVDSNSMLEISNRNRSDESDSIIRTKISTRESDCVDYNINNSTMDKRKRRSTLQEVEFLDHLVSKTKRSKDICIEEDGGIPTINVDDQSKTKPIKNKDSEKVRAESESTIDNKQRSRKCASITEPFETALETTNKNHAPEVNCILLSDDEDLDIVECTKPMESKGTEVNDDGNITYEDEPVSLNASLLSNPNFVKIIAHVFSSRNPNLDKDAAFLAAQYSTQRAVEEIKATGKNLCSGLVYDIAISTIGEASLRRLQLQEFSPKTTRSKVKRKISKNIKLKEALIKKSDQPGQQASVTEGSLNTDDNNKAKSVKKHVPSKKRFQERQKSSDSDDVEVISDDIQTTDLSNIVHVEKAQSTSNESLNVIKEPITTEFEPKRRLKKKNVEKLPEPPPLSEKVVPIKMYKSIRESTPQLSRPMSTVAECILPDEDDDDDDVRVVDDSSLLQQNNSQKSTLNKSQISKATEKNVPLPTSSQLDLRMKSVEKEIVLTENSIVIPDTDLDNEMVNTSDTITPGKISTDRNSKNSLTICLYSDEEEVDVVALVENRNQKGQSDVSAISPDVSNGTETSDVQTANNKKAQHNVILDKITKQTNEKSSNPKNTSMKVTNGGHVSTDNIIAAKTPEIISKSISQTSLTSRTLHNELINKIVQNKNKIRTPNANVKSRIKKQTQHKVMSSIDLTDDVGVGSKNDNVPDLNAHELKVATTKTPASHKTVASTTSIIGSAKDILITRAGDKSTIRTTSPDLATLETNKNLQQPNTTPASAKTVVTNKRPATSAQASTTKKPKTGYFNQLTLEDFDIDEIDDIIELD
ncbi:uncharacterized protein [Battus philenor]|uniref:uncharacterized protein isoform X2 n=1 Tax=Battus philenor TaxID=42288 RepID=UPI0035D0174C